MPHQAVERRVVDAADGPREQQQEVVISVPAAARIAGALRRRAQAIGVEADVEHRVHHARHGLRRPGAHRDEQRPLAVAERTAGDLLQTCEVGADFGIEAVGPVPAVAIVLIAAFGGDGEAGRHVEAGLGHVREARALAADEMLYLAAAVSLALSEEVDPAHEPSRDRYDSTMMTFGTLT